MFLKINFWCKQKKVKMGVKTLFKKNRSGLNWYHLARYVAFLLHAQTIFLIK